MKILRRCLFQAYEGNVTDDFGVEINRELSFRYAVISSR